MNRVESESDRRTDPGTPSQFLQPAIRVKNLRKCFGDQEVVSDVSFDIAQGEILVLLGPSGSGKTTILRIVAGLESADSGEVRLHGRRADGISPQDRKLGVVFQEHALFSRMTVEQNIAFGLKVRKVSERQTCETVDEMLELVHLHEHRKKYPDELSGGQRQRVAIARALAYKPEALLLDKPFSSLDATTRTELRREVRSMVRSLTLPALFITHDQEEALEMGDQIAVLNRGRIEQMGAPLHVYNHPASEFVAGFLGATNVLLGRFQDDTVVLGTIRVKVPDDAPRLAERQLVKMVFRPEDVVLNFQPQFLDTPYFLGRGIIEEVAYVGAGERLVVRLMMWAFPDPGGSARRSLTLADETYAEGFPITVTRTKWEAAEMELSVNDPVVMGLKHFRLLPHYPLRSETGASVFGA
jgi:sulfate transport system ATP-binding protein